MGFKNKNKKTFILRPLPLVVAIALILAVSLGIIIYTKNNEPQTLVPASNPETKGEQPTTAPASGTTNPGTDKGQSGNNETPAPAVNLKEPSESTFVSNHRPELSKGQAMNSVCNTTPGATCKITFTKDGVSKSLPDKTTDSGGAAYWTWSLSAAGLTEGSWKVNATATLGSQMKTAADAQLLEVLP